MENQIDSHIQMPKCVLKEFEKENRFSYYDVAGCFIGTGGHAKSTNTKRGYYSKRTETRLNKEIETPFAEMIHHVKKIDFDAPEFYKPDGFDNVVKKYIYSLFIRSKQMQDIIGQRSAAFNVFSEQQKHDAAVEYGLDIITSANILDIFLPTFISNKKGHNTYYRYVEYMNVNMMGIKRLFLPSHQLLQLCC